MTDAGQLDLFRQFQCVPVDNPEYWFVARGYINLVVCRNDFYLIGIARQL